MLNSLTKDNIRIDGSFDVDTLGSGNILLIGKFHKTKPELEGWSKEDAEMLQRRILQALTLQSIAVHFRICIKCRHLFITAIEPSEELLWRCANGRCLNDQDHRFVPLMEFIQQLLDDKILQESKN